MRMLISSELKFTAITLKLAAEAKMNPDVIFQIVEAIEKGINERWFSLFDYTPQDDEELPPTSNLSDSPLRLSHMAIEDLKKINKVFSRLPMGSTLYHVIGILKDAAASAGMTEMSQHLESLMDTSKVKKIIQDIKKRDILTNPSSTSMQQRHEAQQLWEKIMKEVTALIQSIKSGMLSFIHANS